MREFYRWQILTCHVRHGGFVLWRIERRAATKCKAMRPGFQTSRIFRLGLLEDLIRDSSLRSESQYCLMQNPGCNDFLARQSLSTRRSPATAGRRLVGGGGNDLTIPWPAEALAEE